MKLIRLEKTDATPIYVSVERVLAVFASSRDLGTTWLEYGSATKGNSEQGIEQHAVQVTGDVDSVLAILKAAGVEVV